MRVVCITFTTIYRIAGRTPVECESIHSKRRSLGMEGQKRELKRDTSVLREFAASESKDLLVLYHHLRDHAFDCMNSQEYTAQMLRYYDGGMRVVVVTPRTLDDEDYFLVCLQHQQEEKNALCELSFLCFRQFAGISMLVKKRCFNCNAPTAMKCSACQCAAFCSKACQQSGWKQHKKLCKLIKASSPVVETEAFPLDIGS